MPDRLEQPTLASKVYESVRSGILSGELQPGQPMSRRRIATELRTSPLPVASAFQRLEFEGLLESRPRAGTRVRAVSLEEVRGHFVVREALERQVAMRVALMASDRDHEHLAALASDVDETSTRLDARQYSSVHSRFHRQLAQYSQCAALHEAVDQCHAFAMLWLSQLRPPCGPNTRHQDLVAAVASRDPLRAAHAASDHLAYGMARALDTLAACSRGDPDAGSVFRRQLRKPPSHPGGHRAR